MTPLFDTNILVDYLNGVPEARVEFRLYDRKAISIITWMEVMVGTNEDVEAETRRFLDSFDLIAVDVQIAERAVKLRRQHRIRLPDAVIWATAQTGAMLLITRNSKDFPEGHPGIRAPYKL